MARIALLLLAFTTNVTAQSPAAQRPARADDLTVFVQTVGPGDMVWEYYGHNSIVVLDEKSGQGVSFNYGIFLEPSASVFLSGKLLYRVAPMDAALELQEFRSFGRRVWRQKLQLTAQQKQQLIAFLEWNVAPENRHYDYHYYLDNCSTRVRDALDRALGGQLRTQLVRPIDETFRWHASRLSRPVWSLWAGIQMAQGLTTDAPITIWEETFLPGILQRELRQVSVAMSDGSHAPLVISEEEFAPLTGTTELVEPAEPPSWLWWHLLVGLLVGGTITELARAQRRKLLLIATAFWCALSGAVGGLLVYLWWGSAHAYSANNMNLLYYSPLDLVLLPLLALSIVTGKCGRAAFVVAYAIVAMALIGLLLELIPALSQTNGSLVALAVPIHGAVALVARDFWRGAAEPAPAPEAAS
ncbi:MAG: DUF4105 domain-containing protein [Planctomycetota bacterium]